jgi:hypothetical protein
VREVYAPIDSIKDSLQSQDCYENDRSHVVVREVEEDDRSPYIMSDKSPNIYSGGLTTGLANTTLNYGAGDASGRQFSFADFTHTAGHLQKSQSHSTRKF